MKKKLVTPGDVYRGKKVLNFEESKRCPKCESGAMDRQYFGHLETEDGTEAHKIICQECGYYWWEVCADYVSPKPIFVALTLVPIPRSNLTPEQRARLEVEEIAPESP